MIKTADEAEKIAKEYIGKKWPNAKPYDVNRIAFDGNHFFVYGKDQNEAPFTVKIDREGNVVGWSTSADE